MTEPGHISHVAVVQEAAELKEELTAAARRVLESGQYILGDEVEAFEREMAKRLDVGHVIGVSSGTDALILALRALNIGPGAEVITVPNTFVSTASAIALVGARPVFVDVRGDYNMDPSLIVGAVTPATRAIVPVHLTGKPADMDPILAVAKQKGLAVIEDAAQAILAEYDGQKVGTIGEIGCFSLHPLKTLGACGDAGMLATRDESLATRLRQLRNLGLESRDRCVAWARNSRLDALQAAFLRVKLDYVEAWTKARRHNASVYRQHLAGIGQIRLPSAGARERAVYHTFVIEAERRDELRRHLANRRIDTAVHYPVPIHLQPVAADLGYAVGSFPIAERQAERIVSLPVHPLLDTMDVERVAGEIKEFYR